MASSAQLNKAVEVLSSDVAAWKKAKAGTIGSTTPTGTGPMGSPGLMPMASPMPE